MKTDTTEKGLETLIMRHMTGTRLQGEITRRGTIDVLRTGIKHGALSFDLFYGILDAIDMDSYRSFPGALPTTVHSVPYMGQRQT